MSLAARITALAQAVGADIKVLAARLLPAGGAAGSVLRKNSASDGDAGWAALGAAAYKNIGTSGDTVPLLNSTCTWSGSQLFTMGGSGTFLVAGAYGNAPEIRRAAPDAACWTFHRSGGGQAVHFGLDTDNQIKLGGWSWGTTASWQVNSQGVMGVQRAVYFHGGHYNNGNSSSAITINFNNGQKQLAVLNANCTITLQFPGVGNYQIILLQDATGSRTVTWSGTVVYVGSASAPAINAGANGYTVVSIFWSGSAAFLAASKVGAA